MADLTGIAIVVVAGTSALIGAGRKLLERRRVRRELRERPPLDRTTPEGEVVRVTGVVRALEPLTAPLTGKPCVVYCARADATYWMVRGAARRGMREMVAVSPFLIDRGAEGTVLVEGTHAVLDMPRQSLKRLDRVREEQFLIANGIGAKDRGRVKLEEMLVEEGARVSVAGLIMLDPADAPGAEERDFRDAPAPTLRLTGNVDHPLAIGEAA